MAQKALRFRRKFKPLPVEIDGKDGGTFKYETVSVTRSVEREIKDALEESAALDLQDGEETDDSPAVEITLTTIDKILVSKGSKRTPASKVLRDLWRADEIESADIVDFLNELLENRRPI